MKRVLAAIAGGWIALKIVRWLSPSNTDKQARPRSRLRLTLAAVVIAAMPFAANGIPQVMHAAQALVIDLTRDRSEPLAHDGAAAIRSLRQTCDRLRLENEHVAKAADMPPR